MTLTTRMILLSGAAALVTGTAQAAIDGNALADSYLDQGYDFVEVKVGPTRTKVEAIKGTQEVEVYYDNATGTILGQEAEVADSGDVGRMGKEVKTVDRDFTDDDIGDDSAEDSDEANDDRDLDRDGDREGGDDNSAPGDGGDGHGEGDNSGPGGGDGEGEGGGGEG